MKVISFTAVKLSHGWLGNMSAFPVDAFGVTWRTTEHLFQAMRFGDDEIQELIRKCKSPMAAKMKAKKMAKEHKDQVVTQSQSEDDLANMEDILKLKLQQHPRLKKLLLTTGDAEIIEDCTSRPRGSGLFWGAALKDGVWIGENRLGKLWMKLRKELSESLEPPAK